MKFETTGSGKGDSPRPINKKRFDKNWLKVFCKHSTKLIKNKKWGQIIECIDCEKIIETKRFKNNGN